MKIGKHEWLAIVSLAMQIYAQSSSSNSTSPPPQNSPEAAPNTATGSNQQNQNTPVPKPPSVNVGNPPPANPPVSTPVAPSHPGSNPNVPQNTQSPSQSGTLNSSPSQSSNVPASQNPGLIGPTLGNQIPNTVTNQSVPLFSVSPTTSNGSPQTASDTFLPDSSILIIVLIAISVFVLAILVITVVFIRWKRRSPPFSDKPAPIMNPRFQRYNQGNTVHGYRALNINRPIYNGGPHMIMQNRPPNMPVIAQIEPNVSDANGAIGHIRVPDSPAIEVNSPKSDGTIVESTSPKLANGTMGSSYSKILNNYLD
ncbi:hypothetical protein HK103_005690 [Boothiomyces macroporosus]|uniref:Uncharacterized protein n=1 Tax=Boothiomyces macroporosus TaxID=261099 RepID=A0AAD5UEU3_9FUNG|nr:hypothetical protein HK103_005690 [Boothiomyces macroporosus]